MYWALEFTDSSNYDVQIGFVHTTFDKLPEVDQVFFRVLPVIPVVLRRIMADTEANKKLKVTVCIMNHNQNGKIVTTHKGFGFCSLKETFSRKKGRRVSLKRAIAHLTREYKRMVWHKYFEWESAPEALRRGKKLNKIAQALVKTVQGFSGMVCAESLTQEQKDAGMFLFTPQMEQNAVASMITILDNSGIDL